MIEYKEVAVRVGYATGYYTDCYSDASIEYRDDGIVVIRDATNTVFYPLASVLCVKRSNYR